MSSWIFARVAFYPSLLWGIATESSTKRWYDRIDTHVLLGALPFKSQTKEEWENWGVTQLHLPTVDFNNAPSQEMLRRGVEFIEEMNQNQNSVYVHCKAGRGRSATLATCYVMKAKKLSPMDAHQYIKSKRPHILIASRQWDAIELFYKNLLDQDHCNAT
ncbi:phosphatidylglycerophosphatase and protein-tyrosine phosphatase 1-like isoform X1 [Stylophora pistillata]|uniref:phosphatidylglycerophosphatase and protein-tyrosine phosphatase 1-like isoform X1 n=1 Tax=Stylophora pistillata TaxID=50429 RepID=UPI000C03A5D4|nr:phosphatidylglycerophosphatase and protein-tyrosine phosphatase 1-like isoform X1 [Stylophora pistillata]